MKILTDDDMNELLYLYFNIVVYIYIFMYISICRCVLMLVLIYTNINMNMIIDMRRNVMSILINISILIKHIRIRLYKRVILVVMLVLA